MKIPATVVTGFLGAGKTTLLRHLINHAAGRRLALIINEFGDLGIDRELLLGCGIDGCDDGDVIELANGCICCTVADAFLPTMERLLSQPKPPEHILIETSGLALPKPLVQAFNWPEVRSRVTVDGVVAVIDAPAVAAGRFAAMPVTTLDQAAAAPSGHETPLAELFEDQLACADLIVLNKTDSLPADRVESVRFELQSQVRPQTKIVTTAFGALDPRIALGLAAAAETTIEAVSTHHDSDGDDHDHDEFTTFVVAIGPIADPAALERRIRDAVATHDILRIKGFIDVPGRPMRHVVQAVGPRVHRYYDRPWQAGEPRDGHLVVIGSCTLDAAAVHAALAG